VLLESQTNVAVIFTAAELPVLHTRAYTGNRFGPTLTLLESRPITFQVIGVTISVVAAAAGNCGWNSDRIKKSAAIEEKLSFSMK
jgi:hypothetical protein